MSNPLFSYHCKNCLKNFAHHSIEETKRCSEKWKSNKGVLDYWT